MTTEFHPQFNQEPLVIGFGGGGSTGTTTRGLLDAVEQGRIAGVSEVKAFAFVGTADDGSVTGTYRRTYGTPATGDMRRSTSALSASQDAALDFEARFDENSTPDDVRKRAEQLAATLSYTSENWDEAAANEIVEKTVALGKDAYERHGKSLKGAALGHLVITALAIESDIDQAMQTTNAFMQTRAEVIPISLKPHFLKLRDGDLTRGGQVLYGEHAIDEHVIQNEYDTELGLYTEPDGTSTGVPINPRLAEMLKTADKIVIGPGSVYTSTLPAFMADGTREALADRNLTLVGNLVTQETETSGWTGLRYVLEHERYLQRPVDEIIYNENTSELPNPVIFDRDDLLSHGDYQVVGTDIVSGQKKTFDPNDPLAAQRSELQHNMSAVAAILIGGSLAASHDNEFELAGV